MEKDNVMNVPQNQAALYEYWETCVKAISRIGFELNTVDKWIEERSFSLNCGLICLRLFLALFLSIMSVIPTSSAFEVMEPPQ